MLNLRIKTSDPKRVNPFLQKKVTKSKVSSLQKKESKVSACATWTTLWSYVGLLLWFLNTDNEWYSKGKKRCRFIYCSQNKNKIKIVKIRLSIVDIPEGIIRAHTKRQVGPRLIITEPNWTVTSRCCFSRHALRYADAGNRRLLIRSYANYLNSFITSNINLS